MAAVGQEISKLLREVDDPDDSAANRERIRRLLSASERVMNAALKRIRSTVTATLPPMVPMRTFAGIASGVLRIDGVRVDGRDLARSTIQSFSGISSRWFHALDSKHEGYALVGDAIFFYPRVNREVFLEVVTVHLPDELLSDSQTMEIGDDDVPFVRDLARQMVLFRHRKFNRIPLGASDGER